MSRRILGGWLVTRTLGVLMLCGAIPYWSGFGRVNGDVQLYALWSHGLLHGLVPYKDFGVVYPPGVIPFLALPHTSVNMYVAEFVGLAVLADLACLLLLARGGRHPRGALAWVIGVPLLGPVAWGRFDIFVALALIAALVAIESRRPVLAGTLLGFAGLVKMWPFLLVVLLLPLFASWRPRIRMTASAAGMAVAAYLPLWLVGARGGLKLPFSFETHRGVEIESLPAVPLHIARALGATWHLDQSYGSLDLLVRGSGGVKTASSALMAAAVVALLVWAWRDRGRLLTPVRVTLLLIMALFVFSRVLSPQYLLWLLAVVALYLDRASDQPRLAAWSGLALVATQAVFPFKFADVVLGNGLGVMVVVLHGLVLLVLAGVVVREVFSEPVPSGDPRCSTPVSQEAVSPRGRLPAALSTALRMHPASSPGSSL